MEIIGKYGSAIVYNNFVEQSAMSQIINLLNQKMADGANIRIMPDVHAGAGCVIGYTAKLTDKIVPNLIGVDIGCGISAWKLGPKHLMKSKFDKLDTFIRENIPSGKGKTNKKEIDVDIKLLLRKISTMNYDDFITAIKDICKKQNQNFDYVMYSLGTLGGGNHFIEIDEDDDHNLWLVIHSGSRNFGLRVANYHQNLAVMGYDIDEDVFKRKVADIKKFKKGKGIEKAINDLRKEMKQPHKKTGLECLEGSMAMNYYADMSIAQTYAELNRMIMGDIIISGFYKILMGECDYVQSIHNYINFKDEIIRKGAISAHKDEKVIIPLNMAEGVILGVGKGMEDWNFSAPHGAGRQMSRSSAKQNIRLEDFQRVMKKSGVWSSCIGKGTLDESPQAYKKSSDIIKYLKSTIDITCHMKPVYNFKAGE